MKKYALPLALLWLLISCHTDKDTPSANKTHDEIQGTWRLASSIDSYRDASGAQLHFEPLDAEEYYQLDFNGNILRFKDKDGSVTATTFVIDEAFNEKRITITTSDGDSRDFLIKSFSTGGMQWEYPHGKGGWYTDPGDSDGDGYPDPMEYHDADARVSVYTFGR